MNPNQLGPVTLAGRGYTFKTSGNYLPGEYERLTNLDISVDGSLKNRSPVTFAETDVTDKLYRKFIGAYGPFPILASGDEFQVTGTTIRSTPKLYGVRNGITYEQTEIDPVVFGDAIFDAFSPPGFNPVTSVIDRRMIQWEGFWTYNDMDYYLIYGIFQGQDGATLYTESGLYVVAVNRVYNARVANNTILRYAPAGIDIQSVTAVFHFSDNVSVVVAEELLSQTPSNLYPSMVVKNHFIHKDRVWIACEDTIYFSQATNPAVYAPPAGGFFKFPNKEIKDALALDDNIYVFSDNSISIIRYTTDPNTDPEVILVSDNIGGEKATVVGDAVYFIKDDNLYTIVSNNVQKVTELQLPVGFGRNILNTKGKSIGFTSFDNMLYIFYRDMLKSQNVNGDWISEQCRYAAITDLPALYTYLQNFVYKINLDTNSFSVLDLSGGTDVADPTRYSSKAVPIDAFLVSTEYLDNQARLYFLYEFDVAVNDRQQFVCSIESRNSDQGYEFVDSIPKADGTIVEVAPSFEAWIKDFTPDAQPFMNKKFRSVVLTADLSNDPTQQSQLEIYFGNNSTPVVFDLIERTGERIDQNSYRYGLNQRAQKISFHLKRDADLLDNFSSDDNTRFELSDMQVLWTYTGRGPTNYVTDKS